MAARANYVKIGTFVVLGFGALLLLVFVFGAVRLRHPTVPYVTYFNEAVTGLEVGSPVKLRGVKIGQVGAIRLGPDHRVVEVRSDIDLDVLREMGLVAPHGRTPLPIPSDLRAQLEPQGVTGTKIVTIDYFDRKTNPPPPLSFQPPPNYVPEARSLSKSLETSVTKAMDGLAAVIDRLAKEGLSDKVLLATDRVNELLNQINGTIREVDREGIPKRAALTIDDIRGTLREAQQVIAQLKGPDGLLTSVQRSVVSVGNAGRNVGDATQELDATITEIRRTAEAIRLLADELEREPDMLIKGRARARAP
jgi:ABC-type transporter Mla subunit MlaD